MTTVERLRSAPRDYQPDVPKATAFSRASYVPPAVPSPPTSRNYPPREASVSYSDTNGNSTTNKPKQHYPVIMSSGVPSQWLFTEAELANTPSVLEGLPLAEERTRRAKGVNFIYQAGILLKLPQMTLATASVFFHRFYMRHSMVDNRPGGIHHYPPRSKSHANIKARGDQRLTYESVEQNIAATSLFLATKTEENCRKTKEIVIAVAKVAQKNSSLIIDEQSKEYWRWRDSILLYEELMLELLTFDVVLESPYNALRKYLHLLDIWKLVALRDAAWAFLNDSCLTVASLLIPPKQIAVAAIYFASKFTKEAIPDNQDLLPWWEQIDGTADYICRTIDLMSTFYHENPLKKSDNPYGQSPMSMTLEDLEMTRSGFGGDTPRSPEGLSQNGHVENGQTLSPAANGTLKDDKPGSPLKQSAETQYAADGSSDKLLKEAANDPATHEESNHPTGLTALATAAAIAQSSELESPKRKLGDPGEESTAKRVKTEDQPAIVNGTALAVTEDVPKTDVPKQNELEEGEEGELTE